MNEFVACFDAKYAFGCFAPFKNHDMADLSFCAVNLYQPWPWPSMTKQALLIVVNIDCHSLAFIIVMLFICYIQVHYVNRVIVHV